MLKNIKNGFIISAIILFILLSVNSSVLADIAIPRAKSVSIRINKTFPDFDFYFCVVPVSSYYDKGRHYTTHYEDLSLTAIALTIKKPFIIKETATDDKLFFLAVKKNSYPKDSAEFKKLVTSTIQSNQGNSFYFFEIDTTEEESRYLNKPRNVVYTIEKIGDPELKATRKFNGAISKFTEDSNESPDSKMEVSRSYEDTDFDSPSGSKYVAGGLFLTGIIMLFGFIFIKKSKEN